MDTDEFKKFISKLKSDKKSVIILLVGLTGMILILISGTSD